MRNPVQRGAHRDGLSLLAGSLAAQLARPGPLVCGWARVPEGSRRGGAPRHRHFSPAPRLLLSHQAQQVTWPESAWGGLPVFATYPHPALGYLSPNAAQLMIKEGIALIADNFLVPSLFPSESRFPRLPLGSTRTLCITQDSLGQSGTGFPSP